MCWPCIEVALRAPSVKGLYLGPVPAKTGPVAEPCSIAPIEN
jgi:hypothetical protein